LANALSNLAKEMESIDEQVRLEEIGEEILMKPVEELIGK